MAPEPEQLYSIANPLVTIDQLSTSGSQLDGIPADLESSLRFAGAQLTQAAGILLRLPQEIVAQAVVIFYRFYVGSEGGSFRINALKVINAANTWISCTDHWLGCLCSIPLHDRQNLVRPSIYSLGHERLRLPPLPFFSSTTMLYIHCRQNKA